MSGKYDGYIGVFDSGLGGISVLKEMVRLLPNEDFVYYGDSANAPYGEKAAYQVLLLAKRVAEDLLDSGVKAIVIACNTATSAAASYLRKRYPEYPIIGMEPALKPAALAGERERILVMATKRTIELEKFQQQVEMFRSNSVIFPVPCVGLAARIEKGNLDAPDLRELLEKLVGDYKGKIDSVVLGCTHYPFIKKQIRDVLGDVPFYDGSIGTANQLKRMLTETGRASDSDKKGNVEFLSSVGTQQEIDLYRKFFELPID